MAGELVFTVADAVATPASQITLADAGFEERQHLQEWVISHPEVLGEGVMIVTFEMGRWLGGGAPVADRLDVLGLDVSGQLVVVELKRDQAPDTTEMQAIKYAAFASQYTVELLAQHHAKYLSEKTGSTVSPEDAEALLLAHAEDLSDESVQEPRIVLIAGGFPPVVTASALYLRRVGLDITLIGYQAYETASDEIVLTVSQLIPLPDEEEFTVVPRPVERRREAQRKRRDTKTVTRIAEAGVFEDGRPLRILPPGGGEYHDAIRKWIDEDPTRGKAQWRNDPTRPIVWAVDGETYTPNSLVGTIYGAVHDSVPKGIRAPAWIQTEEGASLVEVAADIDDDDAPGDDVGQGPGDPPPVAVAAVDPLPEAGVTVPPSSL